ncbi:NAD(P)/FAD-dependent oxidoreductase [Motilibacter deserti]|uniref:NAD(P)/FAD-dependent oxidoreductase n=1 Tax=Motilibacter deserti TaxID=2714956 RepID=A0ABX0GY03_9ACTN|nr:NAD(P)/FAD-dependent oxidoreductase [Motilibacter deserti]NHC14447.1 NAD(P)/FAD-dependent oxidoreductase [Motilibacter deserti]
MAQSSARPRIVIVGGGYVGMYTALRLQKKLRRDEAEVIVIDSRSYMTYQPFLPEAAAGNIEPRHIVVPLRRVLDVCKVVTGEVTGIEHARKVVHVNPHDGDPYEVGYDHVIVALGSVPRILPIPGLAERGIGFKRVEEAIYLRNHIIDQLDLAESSSDPELRRRALTFCFVGGGYAGIEAFAELQDMAKFATRYYETIKAEDLRWVLVEAADRILPEVGPEMGVWTLESLRKRGMEMKLKTFLNSCVDGHVVLSDGTEFDTNTVVWTAGVKANPVLGSSDLPLDDRGRLKCTTKLQVEGVEGAWGAGDCAGVPDLTGTGPGGFCSPSAQHAVRQAPVLADNVVAAIRGFGPKDYKHKYAGSVAGLGLRKGVANVYGVKLKGWPAWMMHRIYHMSRVPTFRRKIEVQADWASALFFRREVVSLGSLQRPRHEFEEFAPLPKVQEQPEAAISGPGRGQGQ